MSLLEDLMKGEIILIKEFCGIHIHNTDERR